MKLKLRYLILLSIFLPELSAQQVIVSDWSAIDLGEYSMVHQSRDTLTPQLELRFPQVRDGDVYNCYNEKLTLIGYVEDSSLIKTILFESKKLYHNSSGIFCTEIELKKGYNSFKLIAMDEHMNYSEREIIINCLAEENQEEVINIEGKYYGLFLAVNDYQDHRLGDLQNPINDAKALMDMLVSRYTFAPSETIFLQNPTMIEIRSVFDSLSHIITPKDNLLIFYAGHGYMDEEANIGFWIPSDAQSSSRALWLRNSTIRDLMKEIKAKHTLLVTDACFAGSIFSSRSVSDYSTDAIKRLYDIPSRKAMTSGNREEVTDQSAFIKYYIDVYTG